MKTLLKHTLLIVIAWLIVGCSPSVPRHVPCVETPVNIEPDYAGVTVPVNIAPLNFTICEDGDEFITEITNSKGGKITVEGKEVDIDIDRWHKLLVDSEDSSIQIRIYVSGKQGWRKYRPIKIKVADSIDPYIAYRLIEPSYVNYEVMRISQRNLENFDEKEIFNSRTCAEGDNGQCMNCHSFQDYNRSGNMQMHLRVNHPGTLIISGDKARKVALRTPDMISAGVYPSWHPTLPLIAYSTNTTRQMFHHLDKNKVEVYDSSSDLVLYDVEHDRVTPIAADSTLFETFPYWSRDGRTLYYVAASIPAISADERGQYVVQNYDQIRYDVLKRSFDPATRTFSEPDTLLLASEMGMSATLPRPTPDGRYLLLTMASYGTFHIWHHDADLYLLDLADGSLHPLDEANSPDTESYHSISSNGRWILFSSRRDDGSYTRLYLSWLSPDGKASKPLLLPQRHPADNKRLTKSYNVPELMAKPVEISRSALIEAAME